MKNLIKEAKRSKKLACALLGQAISDEGTIGTDSVKLNFVSKEEAWFLWGIANKWGFVNKFRKFNQGIGKYPEWGFTFKNKKLNEIANIVGSLPNPDKTKALNHLIEHTLGNFKKSNHGVKKQKIIDLLLRKGPLTSRDIMYQLDIGCSTLKVHLYDLRKIGVVDIIGKNLKEVRYVHRRTANLWSITDREKAKDFIVDGLPG